ncbi:zinc finger protein 37-like [Uranotaenia lowii]|uniref:zinc finger protein 37-like n=1 Tax=Uranotaenia lowii TaxID=190385 RepID=UPI00247B2B0F|nr:zinc finger protein 37-like [Uranotaenia lowii]
MNVYAVCRMCISEKLRMRSIFLEYGHCNMIEIISEVLHLNISDDDGLPSNICKPCANTLLKMQDTINTFRQNDQKLRTLIFSNDAGSEKVEGCGNNSNLDAELIKMPAAEHVNMVIKEESIDILDVAPPNNEFVLCDDAKDEPNTAEAEAITEELHQPQSPRIAVKKRRAHDPEKMSRKQLKNLPGRPRLHDHKCYICNVDPFDSSKALLDHLTTHQEMVPSTCTSCVMETVVLKNARALNNHKKMHAQPLKCAYCDRRYCDNTARDIHVQSYHMGEGAPCPSPCDECGKICRSQLALKNHLREHKTHLPCTKCEKVFHKPSKLKMHIARAHENKDRYKCEICDSVITSLEGYNIHLKKHGERQYECEVCHTKFHSVANLCTHKKIHEKNDNYRRPKDWKDQYTVSYDEDKTRYLRCHHCGKTAACTASAMVMHIKKHFKTIECELCGVKFSTKEKIRVHMSVHTKERNFRCEFCGKDYLCRSNLKRHIRTAHKSKENL